MGPPIPDRFIAPALSPSYAPTPTPPWHPPPQPPPSSEQGELIVFLVVAFAVLLLLAFVSDRHSENRRRENRRRAEASGAAAPPRRALPWQEPTRHFEELRRFRQTRAANPATRLPAFKYNRSATHTLTGGEECPVCLGAFQLGETVRLLPLCLHLYHVECIDPWLDTHSTCPICRSDTHPTVDVARRPPV